MQVLSQTAVIIAKIISIHWPFICFYVFGNIANKSSLDVCLFVCPSLGVKFSIEIQISTINFDNNFFTYFITLG